MSYGALLTDQNGVPFYIDGTRPLTLVNKVVINFTGSTGQVQSRDLYNNDGVPRFVFIQSNNSNVNSAEWLVLENGIWKLYSTIGTKTVTVYIFGYANQPLPASGWGIAIWDASGNCILTNESKVLKNVTKLGDISNPNNSGYTINTTLGGGWAVAPTFTGILTAVDNSSGQPRPIVIPFYSSAYFDGANTVLNSHARYSTTGISSPSYSNARNNLVAINVSGY